MSSLTEFAAPLGQSAVLDEAYRRAPSGGRGNSPIE
jgi:hypothetical protein